MDLELTWTDGAEPGPDAEWLPAVVPGGVHESLLAAGRIEDPCFGLNEHDLGWVHDATWWYRGSFIGTDATHLDLAGLDTVAEVRVNGTVVGTARNQHRPHRFALTDLRASNELLVRFPPPLADVLSEEEIAAQIADIRARQSTIREVSDEELRVRITRTRIRKATFSWGWDFAPVVTSRGISGPVTLVAGDPPLHDLRVRDAALDVEARTATLEVTGTADGPATVTVTGPSGEVTSVEGELPLRLDLTDVQLWWTHDLGTPALYQVSVISGDETVSVAHGFRRVEVDRSPDPTEDAELFRFVLNGVPTFARGANVVPATMLVGSWPDSTARGLVELARDGGMTMLRVWGGGVIAPEAIYDACDELGVLVWQDFLFACYDYPDPHGELAEEVALEAAHQVRRLRHHASLALWCGENEIQAIRELTAGSADPAGDWGWAIFNELLPAVVAEHDPDTAYWPGSPWGRHKDEVLNGTGAGDRHAWEVWHGNDVGAGGPTEFASRGEQVHFARYELDRGRFISEFGIHAAPELATLERWTPPGSLALGSAELDQRNKDTPKDKGYALMAYETGEPSTLEEYVDFTMACQAEGLKVGVEHYRRRQPHCSGTLVWQLNDSWPGLSWSVLDYDLVPKASYYFLQRAYQPLLASFALDGDRLELWVTHSGRQPVPLDLVVEVGDLRSEVSATAEPYSSAPVWSAVVPDGATVAWVTERHGRAPSNRRFLGRVKDVVGPAKVDASVLRSAPGRASVELRAEGDAYLVRVTSDLPGARFSTNYVDLRDGETCVVEVTGLPEGAQLRTGHYGGPTQLLTVTSLDGLLAFAARARVEDGYGYLLGDGSVDSARGLETWINARMTHVFSLALLTGRETTELAQHGVAALQGPLRDHEHGGWLSRTGGSREKAAYEHAFVLLAGSSAALAGLGDDLLADALAVWDDRFWDEDAGAARETWDQGWSTCEDYRGANANMHGVEAMLAAAEALPSRRDELLQRCLRVLERIVHVEARGRDWRLPEHFDAAWSAVLDYNRDRPADAFRPFGVTPGHQFEWARLAVHTAAALGDAAPGWLVDDAHALYAAARTRGWASPEGFVYTLDWDDQPVVAQRFHWVLAEAISAAAVLGYPDDQRAWVELAERRFFDPATGSWVHELDPRPPATGTWTGQPDAYHVVQALLLPELPLTGSVARSLLG